MMSLTDLSVTVRITVTYARARYSPHSLRHTAITFILGASLRDVQDYDGCKNPCTTRRHDRARGSLDRHATYIVAAYVAGAAR